MRGKGSGGEGDFRVERMGKREMMSGVGGQRGDDMVVIERDGGCDERRQDTWGRGGEGAPNKLDCNWDGNLEGKEGGDGDRRMSRGLGKSVFQMGR